MFSFDGEERPLPIRIAAMLIWVEAAFVFIYGMAFGAAGIMFSNTGAISMGPLTGSGGSALAIAGAFFVAAIALGLVATTLKHPSTMVRNVVLATQAMVAVFAVVFASDATGLLIHAVPVLGVVYCLLSPEGRQAVAAGDAATHSTTAADPPVVSESSPAASATAATQPEDTASAVGDDPA